MDRLLDLLEGNPAYRAFVLDGQALPLETYLGVRPTAREGVMRLVRARRLFIGPGYVLPDEFLASAESLVRNLLIGRQAAEPLGHVMTVGYSPDSFGHAGQMPQILRGFGVDSFVFSRGLDRDTSPVKNEFIWEGPDGSQVLAIWQRDFYLNANALGYPLAWAEPGAAAFQPELAVKRAKAAIESLLPHNISGVVLLNNGTDYSEPQGELVETLRLLRRELPSYSFSIAGLEDHVSRVRRDLTRKRLRTMKGELLYPFKDLLRGINSTRMPLKRAQHETSTLLERYAEPLSTYAWLANAANHKHFPALLEGAWRSLLKTQPHDDIGGCSVDEVACENMARLEQVRGWARHIARESLWAIGRQVDTSRHEGVGLVVFNPVSWARSDLCRGQLQIPVDEADAWHTFALRDSRGGVIPYVELGRREMCWIEVRRGFHVVGIDLAFVAEDVPPCGYITAFATPGAVSAERDSRSVQARRGPTSFENCFYRMRIRDNGLIDLYDKQTNTSYRGLNLFEDAADTGDIFSFGELAGARALRFRNNKVTVRVLAGNADLMIFEVKTALRVPRRLAPRRDARSVSQVTLPVRIEIACVRVSPRIDVRVEFVNHAADHRLRVLFPTPIVTKTCAAESKFDVVERPVHLPAPKQGSSLWRTGTITVRPEGTSQHDGFVDLTDGARGLAILSRGLPEHEILAHPQGHTIALTLLRSVGWFSRGDVPERPFNAGIPLQVPGAQCLGPNVCEYAIYPHAGGWQEGGALHQAHQFCQPFMVSRADVKEEHIDFLLRMNADDPGPGRFVKEIPREGPLKTVMSFLTVRPRDIVVSAIKQGSRRNNELIVRLYNPGNRSAAVTVRLFRAAKSCHLLTLAEQRVRRLSLRQGHEVHFRCAAKQIVTLGFGM
jgi:alpha-mannosidase